MTDKTTDQKASTRQPVESTQIEREFNVTSKTGAVMHVYAECTEDAMEIAKSVGLDVAECCEVENDAWEAHRIAFGYAED